MCWWGRTSGRSSTSSGFFEIFIIFIIFITFYKIPLGAQIKFVLVGEDQQPLFDFFKIDPARLPQLLFIDIHPEALHEHNISIICI